MIIDGPNAVASTGVLIESRKANSAETYLLTTIRLLLVGNAVPDGSMGSDATCAGTRGKVFAFDDEWAKVVQTGGLASALVLVKLVDPAPMSMIRATLHITLDAEGTTVTPPATGLGSFRFSGVLQRNPAYSFAPAVRSTEPFAQCVFDEDPRPLLEGSLARGDGDPTKLSGWGIVADANEVGAMFAIPMADAVDAVRRWL